MGTTIDINTTSNLLQFFNDSKHVDVKFLVKCGRIWTPFYAHKLVLSLWSSVFADELSKIGSNIEEDVIEITDVLPSAFEALLKYLYGSSEIIKENESNVKFILNVHNAARKYKIKDLENCCWKILNTSTPNKDNVFEFLEAAIFAKLEALEGKCNKIIQTKTDEVLTSRCLENVTPSMILKMLQLPCLSFSSEYELVSWIYDWAEHMFNKNSDSKTHKEIIQPFLPYLNFTALQPEEFATLINKHKMFFDEKESFHVFMNIFYSGSYPLPDWYMQSKNIRKFKKQVSYEKASLNPEDISELMPDSKSETLENQSIIDAININTSTVEENKNAGLCYGNGYASHNQTKAELVPEIAVSITDCDETKSCPCPEKEFEVAGSCNDFVEATIGHVCHNNEIKVDSFVENKLPSTVEENPTISIEDALDALDNIQIEAASVDNDASHSTIPRKDSNLEADCNNISNSKGHLNMPTNKDIYNFNFECHSKQKSAFEELKEPVPRKGIRKMKSKKFHREYKSLPCNFSQGFIQDSPFSSIGNNWRLNISQKVPTLEEIYQML